MQCDNIYQGATQQTTNLYRIWLETFWFVSTAVTVQQIILNDLILVLFVSIWHLNHPVSEEPLSNSTGADKRQWQHFIVVVCMVQVIHHPHGLILLCSVQYVAYLIQWKIQCKLKFIKYVGKMVENCWWRYCHKEKKNTHRKHWMVIMR